MSRPAPPRRTAVVVALLAFLAAALPALCAPSLVRLAEDFAAEIVRAARGRPVEIAVPEDRTGRGGSLALDLRALLVDRLRGRATVTVSGPRLRVQSVLSETATSLVVSARVVEEPGDRLVDLLSVSVPADLSLLPLSSVRPPPAPAALDVVSMGRTPPLDMPVLDLAFFGDDRLVVLGPDSVALYRWDGAALAVESRRSLSGALETVRFPGGILRMAESDAAFWALTSRSPRALLFAVEDGRLVEREEAAALPWPGCPAGLHYRPGTNLIEGVIAGASAGPYLGLDDSAPDVTVAADGVLRAGGAAGPPVGPALAALWPGVVAASSPRPPGEDDAILIVGASEAQAPRVLDSLRVEGAVRALAARPRGQAVRLVAAVEEADRSFRLLVVDLTRPRP
jgi:hypothetical protein